ncbi:RNA pseudouridylate synthase domain containing protein 2, partial [Quaeritorhiza haematococci]
VNRIDRLTSGILLIALTKEKSTSMMKEMMGRNIQKTYLCRVKGEFPEGEVVCEEPILTISFKLGINIVSPEGKPCKTIFQRLSYNGLTSLVMCKPLTGRTHQIRVHLQYLGYPIANDPIYCSETWGENMGKGGVDQATAQNAVDRLAEGTYPVAATPQRSSSPSSTPNNKAWEPSSAESEKATGTTPSESTTASSASQSNILECLECSLNRRDPVPEQLQIYLHSWRYEGVGWSWETPKPAWASDDYIGDQQLIERFWKYGGKWDGMAAGLVLD